MPQDVLRTFVAVELPAEVKEQLWALAGRLRGPGLRASWVSPDNMHLTLRFLGNVDAEGRSRLIDLLADAYGSVRAFPLRIEGVGVFPPNSRRPNVIWAGVAPLDGPLQAIQAAAEQAARAIGLPPEERPFKPHLTVARIKEIEQIDGLMERLAAEREFQGGEFAVHGVSLLSSHLTPKGAVHSCLRDFCFV